MNQKPYAASIAAIVRRALSADDYDAANDALGAYRMMFGPTRGYFNLMREIDHTQYADIISRATYNQLRAR